MLNSKYKLGAIVLAAGLSSRLGGECKHTKLWHGRPLLQYCIDALRLLPLKQVIIVLGHEKQSIIREINLEGFKVVSNPNPELGMGQSIKKGVQSISEKLDGVFMCLGDMPNIHPDIFTDLSQNFHPEESRDICTPVYQNRKGNPVLFGEKWFNALASINGDKGARDIIKKNPDSVQNVEVSTEGIFMDFDEPKDFLR